MCSRPRKQVGSQAILKPLVPVNLSSELLTRPPAHAWCYTDESIAKWEVLKMFKRHASRGVLRKDGIKRQNGQEQKNSWNSIQDVRVRIAHSSIYTESAAVLKSCQDHKLLFLTFSRH